MCAIYGKISLRLCCLELAEEDGARIAKTIGMRSTGQLGERIFGRLLGHCPGG
jgi:hypothetical protein